MHLAILFLLSNCFKPIIILAVHFFAFIFNLFFSSNCCCSALSLSAENKHYTGAYVNSSCVVRPTLVESNRSGCGDCVAII